MQGTRNILRGQNMSRYSTVTGSPSVPPLPCSVLLESSLCCVLCSCCSQDLLAGAVVFPMLIFNMLSACGTVKFFPFSNLSFLSLFFLIFFFFALARIILCLAINILYVIKTNDPVILIDWFSFSLSIVLECQQQCIFLASRS